ncbi:helix-turn-helix domain-containing protein [Salinibacterium sp. ZJ454]|uniref:helix-turn-helix domain-containing protein n=1 Tax=Salinibacterium sp. ZJ454 TaxID=2708339 RepID=UPI001FB8C689|nr:helix-turn-helix domain-containing protein [Salinibacterium sp. ZJ454]
MKPAPAVVRAMSTLNYLTAHPGVSFTLSDLCDALDVNAASLSALLLALSDAGYVTRHPRRKTYTLGPAGVALGHAAALQHPAIEAAADEMRELANLGNECVGTVATSGEILFVAIEGHPGAKSREAWVGQRIPMLPPFGQVFVAWSSKAEIDRWLGQPGEDESAALLRERIFASLERVREDGYVVGLANEPAEEVIALVDELTELDREGIRRRLLEAIPRQGADYISEGIQPDDIYDVANLAVPVFDAEGTVAFAMTLTGLTGIRGARLREIGETALGAARRVTRSIGGKWPAPITPER